MSIDDVRGTINSVASSRRTLALKTEHERLAKLQSEFTPVRDEYRALDAAMARSKQRAQAIGAGVGLGVGIAAVGIGARLLARSGGALPLSVGAGLVGLGGLFGVMGGSVAGLASREEYEQRSELWKQAVATGQELTLAGRAPLEAQLDADTTTWRLNAPRYETPPTIEQAVMRVINNYDHDRDGTLTLDAPPNTPADETVRYAQGGPVNNEREVAEQLEMVLPYPNRGNPERLDTSGDGKLDVAELASGFADAYVWQARGRQAGLMQDAEDELSWFETDAPWDV